MEKSRKKRCRYKLLSCKSLYNQLTMESLQPRKQADLRDLHLLNKNSVLF